MQLKLEFPLVPLNFGEPLKFFIEGYGPGFIWTFVNEIGFAVDVPEGTLLDVTAKNPFSGKSDVFLGHLTYNPGRNNQRRPSLITIDTKTVTRLWHCDLVMALCPKQTTNQ